MKLLGYLVFLILFAFEVQAQSLTKRAYALQDYYVDNLEVQSIIMEIINRKLFVFKPSFLSTITKEEEGSTSLIPERYFLSDNEIIDILNSEAYCSKKLSDLLYFP